MYKIDHNNEFGQIERKLARWLGQFPHLKKSLKVLYQSILWIMYRKKYKYKTNYPIHMIRDENNESFFGYYDKIPVSSDCKHILFYSSEYATKNKPNPNMIISLILQEVDTQEILLRLPVYAYNWQQGSRACWFTDDIFAYNDFDTYHKRYITRVWSISSLSEIKIFDFPLQDAYKNEYFISLNYQRIMALRPDYGYRNLAVLNEDEIENHINDGIWKVDYKTGESILLVSLADIYSVKTLHDMVNAFHKVNHVLISPSGINFIFIHRYYISRKRVDRLFLANSKTGELKLLANYGMVSHCFWVNDKTVLAYLRDSTGQDAYNLIDIGNGNFTIISNDHFENLGDGHPHIHGNWFVTDTYPDKSRMQHLVLVNWKTGESRKLAEFFHGLKYSGETRCDLHPRFSPDGKTVFFDSVFSGKRQLYKMDLSL